MVPISPPVIDLTLLDDTQWDAHFFLAFREDRIECPRGINMSLQACQAMQASRRHFIVRDFKLQDNEDFEDHVRADFLVCQHCEHYSPHYRNPVKDGQTQRKKEQNIKIAKANAAEKMEQIRQTNELAEEQRIAKETARQKSFTSRERKRAEELEAKFAATFARLQEQRRLKSERQSERQKTRFQIFREKERERRETRKASANV
jgi:hypothetical protein